MKPLFNPRNISLPLLTNACLLLLMAFVFTGCPKGTLPIDVATPIIQHIPASPQTQLVVWRIPGSSDAAFNSWMDSVKGLGKVNPPLLCQDCDSTLMLLTGPGIENYIQQATATGGGGTKAGGGPSGGDGPVYYSVNYAVDLGDTIATAALDTTALPHSQSHGNPVVVAVFDTGIDSAMYAQSYFYKSSIASCISPAANNGWNFCVPDANWNDDYPEKHGTTVSRFIVNQVNALNGNSIKLLPVKIHDSFGRSDLFSVLCGFAYAANRGAQIINASFGYYTPRPILATSDQDSCAVLLREYVKAYLTSRNILLIAAAGNQGPAEAGIITSAPRNLDSVSFYPASLARDTALTNVIAVTTVGDTTSMVSPAQNFSPNVVDVGVNADNNIQYYFFNPFNPHATVIGSSFATPIVTGKICANFSQFLNGSGAVDLSKQNILAVLKRLNLVHPNTGLASKIKGGVVMNKGNAHQ